MGSYPHAAKRQVQSLIKALTIMTERDPEQEVQGIAIPVLDAVIETVRQLRPDDPVVQAVRGVISVEQIESGDPIRAADALLVAMQLDAVIGRPPIVVG